MKITKEFHDINGRKYIEIDGERIKIPWRYNRVTGVDVEGLIPIQSMKVDTEVDITVKNVLYEGDVYKILKSIKIR